MNTVRHRALRALVGLSTLYWWTALLAFMLATLPVRLLFRANRGEFDWLERADFEDAARRVNPLFVNPPLEGEEGRQ